MHEEGRYNVTFGGLAHGECPGRAVWPPLAGAQKWVYNPLIALRKMATRDAFSGAEAQEHLQALMKIVSTDYHMPRPLEVQAQQFTSPSTTTASSSSRSAISSSSSRSAISALVPTTPRNLTAPAPTKPTQTPGKRRERPEHTPTATPSPQAKGARQRELDVDAQANQQQPAITSNIQQPVSHNQEESEEETEEKETTQTTTSNTPNNQEESEESEEEIGEKEPMQAEQRPKTNQPTTRKRETMTTNQFCMRDFQFQERVRAGGGRPVVSDPKNKYQQYRDNTDEDDEWQISAAPHSGCACLLLLYYWETSLKDEFKCQGGCGLVKKRGNAPPNACMQWRCEQHGREFCLTCIPVIVRTLDWDIVKDRYRKS
jgi:hypothetical protein